ncbi:MAG: hypothetical protein DRP06_01660 [Candidatus Aenigmatarchaeota archaeon]|nr:MAG: hypothetical protein DRP06_01660 [Candidatus Aenigmarchaeota archaeon]
MKKKKKKVCLYYDEPSSKVGKLVKLKVWEEKGWKLIILSRNVVVSKICKYKGGQYKNFNPTTKKKELLKHCPEKLKPRYVKEIVEEEAGSISLKDIQKICEKKKIKTKLVSPLG